MLTRPYKYFLVPICVIFFSVLAAITRCINISPFKFYPDSYQNLLVAENIRNYGSVVGFLGEDGMLFPQIVMWSRAGYPLFITLFTPLFPTSTEAAQFFSILFGVLAVPLCYFFLKNVWQSRLAGITGTMLLALSFNHTVWSGFIMTETTGVFFLLLTLWSLFRNIKDPPTFANPTDLLTGIVFGFSVITRYEYALLIIPFCFLVWRNNPQPLVKLITLFSGFFLTLIIYLLTLFPLLSGLPLIMNQLSSLVIRGGLITGGVILLVLLSRFFSMRSMETPLRLLTLTFMWSTALLLFLQLVIGNSLSFFYFDLTSLRNFVRDEPLLMSTFLLGSTIMAIRKGYLTLLFFSLGSIVMLSVIYFRINPEMERYWTHLIPFFLIPASFGLTYVIRKLIVMFSHKKKREIFIPSFTILAFFLISFYQLSLNLEGVRNWGDKSWFEESYEETAAKRVEILIPDSDTLLIASFPEPYFYFTGNSTHSITKTLPYIYIPDSLNKRRVIIVNDMGMWDQFPKFASFVENTFRDKEIHSFLVGKPYHYSTRSEKETHPVVLYETTVEELKKKIHEGN